MEKNSYQYIFRFCCDPGFNDAQEIAALERYVDEADVDDVAVFANVEEINTGHMTFQEQDVYLAMMKDIRAMLAAKGVTMSVNQWHSVMHADLGKTIRSEHHFRPMVDVEGNEASLCVCPLCGQWQDYIGTLYARYAQLDPSIVWVEDDFRLHNHDPLVWGGCFCQEHMKRYSQLAGKPLTREEFLAGVLQPGEPHPYRKIWLDVARDTMLSAAQAISSAVRQVSSRVKVGLMSSVPYVHAAEGRDWGALLTTLSRGCAPVDRIHLPAYQEGTGWNYLQNFNMISRMNRAMLPPQTLVYPELENFPYSLFAKSRRFTRFQLISSLVLDPAGMTIDLYDLNGNGIVWEDGYQDMLREVKPFLNEMTASGVFTGAPQGVRILYSQRSAYTIHTTSGTSMEELYPHECFFGGLLPAMGIPCAYEDDPAVCGQIVAVSGQVLRNYTPEQLEQLFRNNFLILNGDALWTLVDMGLGHLAGVEQAYWMKQNDGFYAYEQVSNGRLYRGRQNARASAIVSASDALHIRYRQDAEVTEYSRLYDSFRQPASPCLVTVDRRVLVIPFGHFDQPNSIAPMFLSALRQELVQDALHQAQPDLPMVFGSAYLEPYLFCHQGKQYLYLINGSSDPTPSVTLRCASLAGTLPIWRSWDTMSGEAHPAPCADGTRLDLEIPPMEAVLIRLDAKEK